MALMEVGFAGAGRGIGTRIGHFKGRVRQMSNRRWECGEMAVRTGDSQGDFAGSGEFKNLVRRLLDAMTPTMEMFKGYDPGKFYDEMFEATGDVRPHCAPLLQKFGKVDQRDFLTRKANSELYFLRQGITFNVYHDDRGTERIFPFDPIPRVMPASE